MWSTPKGTIIDGFDATPPSVNLKCIVFTMTLVTGYWFLPSRNKWVLLGLLYMPYLVMAWYDHKYDCNRNRFGPTFLMHYYDWAKPMYSYQVQTYENWHPKWKRIVLGVDVALLIVIGMLAPRFIKWKPK